jgi:hypothetical protein
VADVIRSLADDDGVVPGLRVTQSQQRVLNDLAVCRTAKLGGHVEVCNACGDKLISYNSCDNRHCPKCNGKKQAQWLDARCNDLLPVQYFHVVFTLPAKLAPLALQNKKEVYQLLFQTASQTLKEIAADPKHLGAEIGFMTVLHTWGQTMVHHPHVHCIVPGGGLAPDGSRWISCRENFFLPVRVLSRLFRGKFLAGLRTAYRKGDLKLYGSLAELTQPDRFSTLCDKISEKEWVVYSKPPFGSPETVLKYLAAYTHRVAISNYRIVGMDANTVSFRYKDYAKGNALRVMQLTKHEFLRRFLQHVLPNGFTRIRYYGFLANTSRKKKLAQCRNLIPEPLAGATENEITSGKHDISDFESKPKLCKKCGKGYMLLVSSFDPQPGWIYEPPKSNHIDSS